MALDTKVPDGQPDSRTDGKRQNNIPPPETPLAGDKNSHINYGNLVIIVSDIRDIIVTL
ncbi:hypothetical protein DPMN_007543 [Dreissena polymorpha]|nr:hypothetical protein DPMN_007543 [Dreissena polymorpha]